MSTLKWMLTILLIGLLGLGGFIYSGIYSVAADDPHNALTYWLLETMRERSIARASAEIEVPSLDSAELLLAGGPDYNEMCAICHLKPGRRESDFSIGLYPKPPDLTRPHGEEARGDSARRLFWTIKHGIKASGMPAWGPTHDDARIWAMVAFLLRLPELTPAQYQIMTARDGGGDHH